MYMDDNKPIKISVPGSYLLIGPAEACRQYVDRIVEELQINWEDIKEIRPEESKGKTDITSIDQIRDAGSFINLTPIGTTKLLIISDAASMPLPAANSLLKTLEEPPQYAMVVLISQTENLLPTILSRCQKLTFWQKSSEPENRWNFDELLSEPFYQQSKIISEVVESQDSQKFLAEFESWARICLRREKNNDKAGLIREIINAKRDIRGNVIPRIVLETLILRYIYHV